MDTEKSVEVDILFMQEDSSFGEWSSLSAVATSETSKRRLYREGLYDPGIIEQCEACFTMSASSVLMHPYYAYPAILNPGIKEALLKPEPKMTLGEDVETYLAACQEMDIYPMRLFLRSLPGKSVDLKYYGVNSKAFRAIALSLSKNKTVKSLNLKDNWMTKDGCYHIGEMLRGNTTLTELILSGCKIGSEGAQQLCFFLRFNRTLIKLDLACNDLEDEGVEYLSQAIIKGSDIENVNLSRNNLTAKALVSLSNAFEIRNKLTHLNLSWNTIVKAKPVLLLCTYLSENKKFQELDMSWTSLEGAIVGQAIKLLIVSCPKVKRVILRHNKLTGPAVKSIGYGLHRAAKLQTLDLSSNPLTPKDAMELLIRMKNPTVKLIRLLLDNVTVEADFITVRNEILAMRTKKVSITCGYVRSKVKGPSVDMRQLLLRRIVAVGNAPKRKKDRVDAVLLLLEIQKTQPELIPMKDFLQLVQLRNLKLSEDLVSELCTTFPGSKSIKFKVLDVNALVDYMKRLWPDKQLPATPPEPSVEVILPPPKERGDKKKKK